MATNENDRILERMRGMPAKSETKLEALSDPTNPNVHEANDNEFAASSTEAVARVLRSNRWRAQSLVVLQAEQFESELRALGYVVVEAP